jgi:hypothetical protein
MTRVRPGVLRTYLVALTFLLLVALGEGITALISPHQSAALRQWASTNVANLHQHPVQALVLSAFLPSGSPLAWLALIALTMFGANRAVGNARLLAVCAAGHLLGTAVSEGILAYRIDHHTVPASMAHIIDTGASYIVVSAIVVAVVFGSWPARIAAVLAFGALVFAGHIFAGLTSLDVSAVGHLTAMIVASVLGPAIRPRAGRVSRLAA